ncbi:hypothetical protein, partial [Falsiroseomonas sp. HW251]
MSEQEREDARTARAHDAARLAKAHELLAEEEARAMETARHHLRQDPGAPFYVEASRRDEVEGSDNMVGVKIIVFSLTKEMADE